MHPIKRSVKRKKSKFSINLRLYSLDNIEIILYNSLINHFQRRKKYENGKNSSFNHFGCS